MKTPKLFPNQSLPFKETRFIFQDGGLSKNLNPVEGDEAPNKGVDQADETPAELEAEAENVATNITNRVATLRGNFDLVIEEKVKYTEDFVELVEEGLNIADDVEAELATIYNDTGEINIEELSSEKIQELSDSLDVIVIYEEEIDIVRINKEKAKKSKIVEEITKVEGNIIKLKNPEILGQKLAPIIGTENTKLISQITQRFIKQGQADALIAQYKGIQNNLNGLGKSDFEGDFDETFKQIGEEYTAINFDAFLSSTPAVQEFIETEKNNLVLNEVVLALNEAGSSATLEGIQTALLTFESGEFNINELSTQNKKVWRDILKAMKDGYLVNFDLGFGGQATSEAFGVREHDAEWHGKYSEALSYVISAATSGRLVPPGLLSMKAIDLGAGYLQAEGADGKNTYMLGLAPEDQDILFGEVFNAAIATIRANENKRQLAMLDAGNALGLTDEQLAAIEEGGFILDDTEPLAISLNADTPGSNLHFNKKTETSPEEESAAQEALAQQFILEPSFSLNENELTASYEDGTIVENFNIEAEGSTFTIEKNEVDEDCIVFEKNGKAMQFIFKKNSGDLNNPYSLGTKSNKPYEGYKPETDLATTYDVELKDGKIKLVEVETEPTKQVAKNFILFGGNQLTATFEDSSGIMHSADLIIDSGDVTPQAVNNPDGTQSLRFTLGDKSMLTAIERLPGDETKYAALPTGELADDYDVIIEGEILKLVEKSKEEPDETIASTNP